MTNFWVWSEKFIDHNKIDKIKQAALESINQKENSLKLNPKQIDALQNNFDMNYYFIFIHSILM